MQEVKIGDIVLLYQPDSSVTTNIIVISPTEVQLINPKVSSSVFDAVNAPIYQRGTQPGQWQPMNEEPQEDLKMLEKA